MCVSSTTTRLALLLLATGPAFAADGPTAKPRYALAPGREFVYRSETRPDKGDTTYHVDWKTWVVGREPDGSWTLVLRCDLKSEHGQEGGAHGNDKPDTLVWRCRLFDDGRLEGATKMGTVRDPFRLFPRLPDGPEQRQNGWDSKGPEIDGSVQHHRLTSAADAPALTIATTSESAQDKVYLTTHEYRATFDPRRGVVTRVETEDNSRHLKQGLVRGVIELTAVEDRGPEWAAEFGREAGRYFAAMDAYEAALAKAGRDADRSQAILAEARAKLEEARAGLKSPVFLDAVAQRLDQHDATANYYADEAKARAQRLGKAAADWEAKDVDGKTHRLADYRGKVVVLDFWYRNCGWCMHAMPQVNRLAETFRDAPVAVLGMSTDGDEKDARAVVEAMGLKYPTIKAAGLPEKYGVSAFPTLVVIDRAGTVREVHTGYSPRLYDELSALIRRLLDDKPAK